MKTAKPVIILICENWIFKRLFCNTFHCMLVPGKIHVKKLELQITKQYWNCTWLLFSCTLLPWFESGKCTWQPVSCMTRFILFPPLPITCEWSVCDTSSFNVARLLCKNKKSLHCIYLLLIYMYNILVIIMGSWLILLSSIIFLDHWSTYYKPAYWRTGVWWQLPVCLK